jgi:hypothetical protein
MPGIELPWMALLRVQHVDYLFKRHTREKNSKEICSKLTTHK